MGKNCENCKFRDEFGFCKKIVVDTKRVIVENGKIIKSYYIDEREENDPRISFITPINFKCIFHENKQP